MILYTDGACSRNGSPDAKASWAFLEHDNGEVIHESFGLVEGRQSNNTGELTAILKAMQYAYSKKTEWCVIFSDSLYAINSITIWDLEKRTKGQLKSNYDLIKEIKDHVGNTGIQYQLQWVKGHSVSAMNNMVDLLATEALKNV